MFHIPVIVTTYLAWLAIDPSDEGKKSRVAFLDFTETVIAMPSAEVATAAEMRAHVTLLRPRCESGWRSKDEMVALGKVYWFVVATNAKELSGPAAQASIEFARIVGERFTKTLAQARSYTPSLPGVDWSAWWPGKKNKK